MTALEDSLRTWGVFDAFAQCVGLGPSATTVLLTRAFRVVVTMIMCAPQARGCNEAGVTIDAKLSRAAGPLASGVFSEVHLFELLGRRRFLFRRGRSRL
jgi:hypothetical protein